MTMLRPLAQNQDPCDSALVAAFETLYISIAVFDLCTGRAAVLKSALDPEAAGLEFDCDVLVNRYVTRRACEADRAAILEFFSREHLEALAASAQRETALEVRCLNANGTFEWVELSLSVMDARERKFLVTTRNIDRPKLLQSIVSRFLFRNCDYVLLIDAHRDTYALFGATQEQPVPPDSGSYTTEMIQFNQQYVVPEDLERVTANMQIPHLREKLAAAETYAFTCGALTKGGAYQRSRLEFANYDKATGLILLMRTDITLLYLEEKARNEQLMAAMREAQTDALTGLYNPKTTSDLVARALARQDYKPAALLFVDVDNFKQVNDTLGHLQGDALLCALAATFKRIVSSKDIIGRVGGDEFILYLPGATSREDAAQCAARICSSFDAIDPALRTCSEVSCSVGIALYPQDGTNYETLVRKADQALYTAKRYGKNTYYFFSEGIGNKQLPSMLSAIDSAGDARH